MSKMTWEETFKALEVKMAEIRATEQFQERDWEQLQRDAIKLRANIRKIKGQA